MSEVPKNADTPLDLRRLAFYQVVDEAFSPAECDSVLALARTMQLSPGTVEAEDDPRHVLSRKSSVAWLPHDRHTGWIYEKLFGIIDHVNRRLFRFNLSGSGSIQVAHYGTDEHYHWHIDLGQTPPLSLRKLSATLQLSDPADYDGGELQIRYGEDQTAYTAPKDRGSLTVFPSFAPHRISPITRGQRYSLTVWIVGDAPFA